MYSDVSVAIPVFNGAPFIEQTLDSVRNQTVQPQELIVLNDGSTDKTLIVVKEWSKKYSYPVTILNHQTNYGIGKTRYDLADCIKTKYLAYLSSDDAWHKDFLKETLPFVNEDKAVFTEYYVCNERLEPTKVFFIPHKNIRSEIIKWALRKNMFINFSCVLIPKKIFSLCQFNQDLNYGEDLLFLLDSIYHELAWYPLCKPLLYYRVHANMGTLNTKKEVYEHTWELIKPKLRNLNVPVFTIYLSYRYWAIKTLVKRTYNKWML